MRCTASHEIVKYVSPLFLLIILFSCNDVNQQTGKTVSLPTSDTFFLGEMLIKIDTIVKSEFDRIPSQKYDTTEVNCILRDSLFVKRSRDTLAFNLKSGKQPLLINCNADNDSFARYSYKGYNPDINQFISYGGFYEWDYYILIDKETGDTTITCGRPVASPNKKYFISGNSDLIAGYTFNGLEIYENTSPPKLKCSRAFDTWGPIEIKWINDTLLYVEASVFDSTSPSQEKVVYYKLTIR